MRFDFVTIFPAMFQPLLDEGIFARGVKQGVIEAGVWDLRDFASDKHRSTDDEAYGGGPGMVMLAEPVLRCLEKLASFISRTAPVEPHIVMTTPQGRRFDQTVTRELREKRWLVFLCGRYEGFDHRVHELLEPDEISIGDFVVSGGELPSMVIADSVARLVAGVVGNSSSVEEDSFYRGLLDYPHYTRPEEIRGRRVPDVLLSGHHEKIRRWRREQALRATLAKRPDLLHGARLDEEAEEILQKIKDEG